jgi:hypothetical protein
MLKKCKRGHIRSANNVRKRNRTCKKCQELYRKTNTGKRITSNTQLYSALIYSARRRGIECSLTYEQFCSIRGKLCEYCNGKLPEYGSGVDRKENKIGYTQLNSLPCCWSCNQAKGENLSYAEMKAVMEIRNNFA